MGTIVVNRAFANIFPTNAAFNAEKATGEGSQPRVINLMNPVRRWVRPAIRLSCGLHDRLDRLPGCITDLSG